MKLLSLTIKKINSQIQGNSLFTNSLNLMLASGISAAFGFLFWVIIAHTFATETIGLATTMLSVASLLSLLGLAGFDSVFVRFLSKSKNKNEQISSGLMLAGLMSATIAIIFCLFIPIISPKLLFLSKNLFYVSIFAITTIFMTWNTLTNSILVAYRKTSFVLKIDLLFSVVKITLPFLIHVNQPILIFAIVGFSQIINVLLSVGVLVKYFGYIPSLKPNLNIIKETLHYGIATYIANIFNLLPDSVLPLIVINYLGATAAAYFYVAFSIANLLYTIAFSINQVLLAEASHDEKNFIKHAKRGLAIASVLQIPAVVLVILFCPFVLNIFGHNYNEGAVVLLRVLSLSGIAVMFYAFMGFIFKQMKNLKGMLIMTVTNAVAIIALSLIFIKPYGLTGVGWAWLIGTIVSVFAGLLFVGKKMPSLVLLKYERKATL